MWNIYQGLPYKGIFSPRGGCMQFKTLELVDRELWYMSFNMRDT